MKILIELPTWLGDSVMASPAIESIANHFNNVEITLLGSFVSIEAIKYHPNVVQTYVLDKKYAALYKNLKDFEKFDIFFSFRSSYRSKFIKFIIMSAEKYQFNKKIYKHGHQVEKYNNFINDALDISSTPGELILHPIKKVKNAKSKLLGINPGASYGSSKQWYPKKFADVAEDLASDYDIIIFGGANDEIIASDIEGFLIEKGIKNYQNLSGQTSIYELLLQIKSLDLFITGDSGPMHIAAAYNIPTVAIFGPTDDLETSQWMNKKNIVVKKKLNCQPCMKRICPLQHHHCMKLISSSDVLKAVKRIN
jgi:heptosyltransferase II